MSTQSFGMKNYMKGALLLTVAAIVVKILSAVYRVPYQNMVGDQGFYVYQQVYPFISFFVVWTSSGFAVAISKMLADLDGADRSAKGVRQAVSRIIFGYLTMLSLLFFSGLFFGANYLAALLWDPKLAPLFQTGAFVALCMPLHAMLKGTFQSRGNMQPVAYAQVFEQTIRVAIILVGTTVVMATTKSVYSAGKMALFGTVIGEVAGVLLLLWYMRKAMSLGQVEKFRIPIWPVIKEVTIFSVAISMSGLLLLCFQLVDSFTVYSMLVQAGMPKLEAMALKGVYDRGQPLVQLGIVIASSLALTIVPLVAFKSKNENGRGANPFIQLTYRASLIFGVAAALGLMLVMPYVNTVLFKTDALSSVLIFYVLQIVPLSIILAFTAILQGYSKLLVPTLILVGAIVMKYIGNILFIDSAGLMGVAVTSNVALFSAAILLVMYLKKFQKIQLAPLIFYRQLTLASLVMVIVVKGGALLLNNLFGGIPDSRLTSLFYCGLLILAGAFTFITWTAKMRLLAVKEWFLIPAGRHMAAYQLWLNRKK